MKHACSMTLYRDGFIVAMFNDVYFEYDSFDRYESHTSHNIRLYTSDGLYKGIITFETGEIKVFYGDDEEFITKHTYYQDGTIVQDMEVE